MNIRVKICGVTRPEDVAMCAEFGADAVGINFFPQSPRYVDPRTVAPLLRVMSPLMTAVGVFVGQPLRQVFAQAYQLGLRSVQWYGDDAGLGDPFPFSVIHAFRVRTAEQLVNISRLVQGACEAGHAPGGVLVDAFVEGQMGGTGHRAPWDLLSSFRTQVPLILAGGLTPDNVAEAIRVVRPAAVDVASGVESAPGKKDWHKVRDFIQNARQAAASLTDV